MYILRLPVMCTMACMSHGRTSPRQVIEILLLENRWLACNMACVDADGTVDAIPRRFGELGVKAWR